MNRRRIYKKLYKSNKNGFLTAIALFFIAFTQVPIAIKNAAEVFCIGQLSNNVWLKEKNHSESNIIAVQRCNGRT
tara:strand:+ start:315 stop:539 length:225 start_codon:yes stop_codon:yes gene_type:complete